MRIASHWQIDNHPMVCCPQCGASLVPFLPHCTACHHPVQPGVTELAPVSIARLTKPTQAVRVAHLSDLHVGHIVPHRHHPVMLFKLWLHHLQQLDVDVLVVSGDLVERPGDRHGLLRVHALLEHCGMPWLVVPGNHDLKRPGHHDIFNDIYGQFPRVQTHHDIDFVLFDSMAGLPLEERDVAERMYGDYVCYTEGRIGAAQFDEMSYVLSTQPEQRQRVIVLHHHIMRQHADLMPHVPKRTGITEDLLGTMKTLMDADRLLNWAKRHHVHTILHGHKHLFQQPGMRPGNILVLNGGSSTLRDGHQLGRLIDHLPDHRHVIDLELHV